MKQPASLWLTPHQVLTQVLEKEAKIEGGSLGIVGRGSVDDCIKLAVHEALLVSDFNPVAASFIFTMFKFYLPMTHQASLFAGRAPCNS